MTTNHGCVLSDLENIALGCRPNDLIKFAFALSVQSQAGRTGVHCRAVVSILLAILSASRRDCQNCGDLTAAARAESGEIVKPARITSSFAKQSLNSRSITRTRSASLLISTLASAPAADDAPKIGCSP